MEFLSNSGLLLLCVLAYAMSLIELYFYYAYFFLSDFSFTTTAQPNSHKLPAVSVIVCTRDENENLKSLIPAILGQNHPSFELILVADRADHSMQEFLKLQKLQHPAIQVIRISETPQGISPKKHALEMGIQQSVNPVLLFTDADCLPASRNWISSMAMPFIRPETEIVLGYGAYRKEDNFLNLIIRYDTIFTAGQYLGMALAGKPYMGVGRNLAYRKELFIRNGGFGPHQAILSGDDDLLVNRLANPDNVAVCMNPEAFTVSKPCSSLSEWFRQKIRHQSVGVYYRKGDQKKLGLLHLCRSGGWLLSLVILVLPAGLVPGISLLLLRSVSRYFPLHRLSKSLQENIWPPALIMLDAVHSLFLAVLALKAVFFPPKKWK